MVLKTGVTGVPLRLRSTNVIALERTLIGCDRKISKVLCFAWTLMGMICVFTLVSCSGSTISTSSIFAMRNLILEKNKYEIISIFFFIKESNLES